MFYNVQIAVVFFLMIGSIRSDAIIQLQSDPVGYTIEVPQTVKLGNQFTITIVFNIQSGWYVYAPIDMNTNLGKIPTKVSFKTIEGLKKIGGLELPDQNRFFDTYHGKDVRMSQKFQVEKGTLSGKQTIKANIIYQTCNDVICYPPVKKEIDLVITIE